ncbi:carbon storage regulator CsrA [Angustibacter sp. Root456]|jgi:carbon storage regulator|uniref:carbon storage regulator CsrA n=1 Tax=Angustibacter sp. Root456 TaxID=1736539 RepID=UPI0006FBBF8A|nr:carbon storage regulator CsrA [Angustibacter sp. Root456]KQX67221.1 carbon storage regulator [Angustibacter sp. Root456]
MLVLTRRIGESLVIGDEVVIRVLDVKGDVVRIGVDAPRHVQIHRQEVYEAVMAANRAAAASSDAGLSALQDAVQQRRPGADH